MQNKSAIHIIKIGGNIIDDPSELHVFLKDFAQLKTKKILVHGGGKSATKMAKTLGLTPQMLEGRRITDAAMLEVVVGVYAGQINKHIVAQLQALLQNSLGFSGADANLIVSEKRQHPSIDYGFVGDVKSVNTDLLKMCFDANITPIVCAITHDGKGQLLNTNADTIAAELAMALAPDFDVQLTYCFEKTGVLLNVEDEMSVIKKIDVKRYEQLKSENTIHSGMIPKLDNCFRSLEKGVSDIRIGHHKMLKETNATYTKICL